MIGLLETLTKIPLYAGLLTLLGACMSFWLVRNRGIAVVRFGSDSVSLAAALVVAAFLVLRLVAHTYATFGDDALTWESLSTIALKSRWGGGWRVQFALSVVAVVVALWARREAIAATLILTIVAFGLAAAFPLVGHTAGAPVTRVAATIHLIAAGSWLGTLGVLIVSRYGGPVWAGFSPIALVGSSLVVLSGLVMASAYVGTPADLVVTAYGRVFLIKMSLFLGIAACGFLNWRRVRTTGAPSTARLELSLAAALIVVTAFLTEIAHP